MKNQRACASRGPCSQMATTALAAISTLRTSTDGANGQVTIDHSARHTAHATTSITSRWSRRHCRNSRGHTGGQQTHLPGCCAQSPDQRRPLGPRRKKGPTHRHVTQSAIQHRCSCRRLGTGNGVFNNIRRRSPDRRRQRLNQSADNSTVTMTQTAIHTFASPRAARPIRFTVTQHDNGNEAHANRTRARRATPSRSRRAMVRRLTANVAAPAQAGAALVPHDQPDVSRHFASSTICDRKHRASLIRTARRTRSPLAGVSFRFLHRGRRPQPSSAIKTRHPCDFWPGAQAPATRLPWARTAFLSANRANGNNNVITSTHTCSATFSRPAESGTPTRLEYASGTSNTCRLATRPNG